MRRLDGNGDNPIHRLPPQPARLLALLADKRGELLSREEIHRLMWPEVRVDFDKSLHFCIRQVRAALGDSAAEQKYIENLPRRGYRLKPAVDSSDLAARQVARPVADGPTPRGLPRRGLVVALAVVVVAVALATLVTVRSRGADPVAGPSALRIGIMPFIPPPDVRGFAGTGPIAESILEHLGSLPLDQVAVVGPSTTTGYADSTDALRRLASDYDLDYVVNGRFIESETGPRLLAELIRLPDGAHVWVRPYDDPGDARGIGAEIADHVRSKLGLDAP